MATDELQIEISGYK